MKLKKALYTDLLWDSRLFGYKVARLNEIDSPDSIKIILHELKKKKYALVYWFVDSNDKEANRVATKHKGLMVDKKVTYSVLVKNVLDNSIHSSQVISYKKRNETDELVSLALQSGKYSRFVIDVNFARDEYKKMYTMWLKRSLKREIAFNTLVFLDDQKKARGFITLESKDRAGSIGLLAVDSAYRRQSIGKKLLHEAFRLFDEQKFKAVTVTTQGVNKAACLFYESLGFKLLKSQHVYHFWL